MRVNGIVEQQHILIRLSSIRHVEDEHSGSGITGIERWGVDTQLAGEIVSAAQTTYPNCF
ncbi:MAG: hypothetical protein ACLP3C_36040 [Mycobacterium sp.]|uniref:hypothetical protein n=1 Tax=Mycobacterium sp. TaxID=1785 RepID=UPI003F971683